MAKVCDKCGAIVGDKARFCGKCGSPLLVSSQAVQSSDERIPTWSGWNVPASETTHPDKGQQTSAIRFSKPINKQIEVQNPPTASQAPVSAPKITNNLNVTNDLNMPTAPQFWESYDYQGSQVGQTEAYSPSASQYVYESRPDASRPLPKLDDMLGSANPNFMKGDLYSEYDELDEDLETKRAKAYDTISTFSLWCAGLVLFPMPFMDLVFLMPIQSAMVVAVSKIYGVKESPEKSLAILASSCGASAFGQFTTLLLANFFPFFGKLLSAPFIFGWSYGLGEVAIRYFESKGTATKDELKSIFKKASKEASNNYDAKKVNPREALENIRNYVSEDEYRKIRERFGPHAN